MTLTDLLRERSQARKVDVGFDGMGKEEGEEGGVARCLAALMCKHRRPFYRLTTRKRT